MLPDSEQYTQLLKHADEQEFPEAMQLLTSSGDVNAQLEVLTRIAMTISRARAQELARDIALARDHANLSNRVHTMAHALEIARALSRDLVLARALSLDLNMEISIMQAGARANFLFHALSRLQPPAPVDAADIVAPSLSLSGLDIITPDNLGDVISPYLQCLVQLQAIINDIQLSKPEQSAIKLISYTTMIGLEMTGIEDAVQIIWEQITPWEQQYSETIQQWQASQSPTPCAAYDSIRAACIRLALDIVNGYNPGLAEPERFDYAMRLFEVICRLIANPLKIEHIEPTL